VKFNQSLCHNSLIDLIQKLKFCSFPQYCAHNRPTATFLGCLPTSFPLSYQLLSQNIQHPQLKVVQDFLSKIYQSNNNIVQLFHKFDAFIRIQTNNTTDSVSIDESESHISRTSSHLCSDNNCRYWRHNYEAQHSFHPPIPPNSTQIPVSRYQLFDPKKITNEKMFVTCSPSLFGIDQYTPIQSPTITQITSRQSVPPNNTISNINNLTRTILDSFLSSVNHSMMSPL
jgi:hypothetical protein